MQPYKIILKTKPNQPVNPQQAAEYPPRTGKLQHPEVPLIFNLDAIMKYRIILIWANHIDREIYYSLLQNIDCNINLKKNIRRRMSSVGSNKHQAF